MKITAQIAALNEEESLPLVFKEMPVGIIDEVLVIDGHSTDRTREVAEAMGARVLLQPKKKGFGDAHKFGFKNARGEVIVIINADGSMNPAEIPSLVKKIEEGYDLVLGSRYLPGGSSEDDTIIRFIGNKIFTFLTNLLFRAHFSDSLYFFIAGRRDKLLSLDLRSDDFALCIELIVKARRAGFKICDVPCRERRRFAGKSKVNAFKDGFKILWQMIKWALGK